MSHFFLDVIFDTEGTTELVSVGIVSQEGREYYAINKNYIDSIKGHFQEDPNLKPCRTIIKEVKEFLFRRSDTPAEFWWAWHNCDSYDWYDVVLFFQFWDKIIDPSTGFPRHCNDIIQIMKKSGLKCSDLPSPENRNNCLINARWVKIAWQAITQAQNPHLIPQNMKSESEIIDVEIAFYTVKEFCCEIWAFLSNVIETEIILEEVELSDDRGFWLVTVSFSLTKEERIYKLFRVNAVTGKIESMVTRLLD